MKMCRHLSTMLLLSFSTFLPGTMGFTSLSSKTHISLSFPGGCVKLQKHVLHQTCRKLCMGHEAGQFGRRSFLSFCGGSFAILGTSAAQALGAETLKNRSPLELQFEMFKEALDYGDEGNFDAAESIYTDIVEEFETPTSRIYGRGSNLLSRAYNMRGQTRLRLERPEEALNDFSKALEMNPDKPDLWYNKGIAYQMIGDARLPDAMKARQFYASALSSYENALVLEPGEYQFYLRRAESFGFLGEHQQALTSYKKAAALAPFDPEVKTKLALEQIQCGNVQAGGKLLEKTLFVFPDNAQTTMAVAALYWQYGRLAESEGLFQLAVSSDPRLMDPNYLMVGLRWPPVARNLVKQMVAPQKSSLSNKLQSIGMFAGNDENIL